MVALLAAVLIATGPAFYSQLAAAEGSLPVGLIALPSPDVSPGKALVSLLVEVPGAELVRGVTGDTIQGEVWAVARDREGTVADAFVEPFVVSALEPGTAAGEDASARFGLKLVGALRLPPGSYQLQVTVSTGAARLTGSAGGALEIPDFAAGRPVVSAPLFPEPVDHWRVLRQTATAQHAAIPFETLGDRVLPRAVVELPLDEPVRFRLITYHLPEITGALDARLLDLEGAPVRVEARVEQQAAGALPSQRWLDVVMDAEPPAAGVYWLDVGLPGAERRVRVPLRFVDAPAAAPGAVQPGVSVAVAPTTAETPVAGAAAPAARQAAEPFDRAKTPAAMAAHYREALGAYAGGDADRAVDLLYALETSAAAGERRAFEPLRKGQRAVVDDLVAARASLLPVIHLHSLVDSRYVAAGTAWLGAQNRVFVGELVDRWSSQDDTGEAREVGSLLLASLGASHRALEVDPENSLALLRLAMDAEKSGQSALAAGYLERLVQAVPTHAHGRLRLAVALRRLSRTAEARSLLVGLTEAASSRSAQLPAQVPQWVAALAFQELAMLERDAGMVRQAEATLRQGIAATGVQALHLQLAFYLDLQQRRAEAEAVLDEVALADTGLEESPRHRYNGPPEAELDAARERVSQAVTRHSGELRAWLGGGAPAGAASR